MSAASKVKDVIQFAIEISKGPHMGQKLSFTKASVTIGRGPENDVVLSSDPRVSRQHAEIKQRGADFVIVNLSQKNFVLLEGQSIQSEVLVNGSVIQIGDTEIQFRTEAPASVAVPAQPAPMPAVSEISPLAPAGNSSLSPKPQTAQMPAMPSPSAPPTQPMSYGGYSPPPPGPAPGPLPSSGGGPLENPRVRFYAIIAVIGILAWFFLFSGDSKEKKDPNAFRTSTLSMVDIAEAEKRTQDLLTVKKEKYDSIQYRRAQENFIKGFRDFQQGQYARAREAFQVVLNLDPENELAKRYFHLSKIKFDELVKFNMIQGNRYREKKNWRMCQSNYSNVMTMLQHRKDDPSFKEAKQFYEECSLNLEGRF